MKSSVLVFLITLLAIQNSFAQDRFTPKHLAIMTPSDGPRLLYQCSRSTPDGISGFWAMGPAEKQVLQNQFKSLHNVLAKRCCDTGRFYSKKSFQDYCFQCVGVTIRQKRYIYINAVLIEFPDSDTKRLKEILTKPVIICGGGPSWWGILFNPDTKSFTQYKSNGPR